MFKTFSKKNTPKILAFFGSDIKEIGIKFLRRMHTDGYTLLALDVPAIGLVSKAGLSYTVIDDWVDSKIMRLVFKKTLYCQRRWFESARKEFTIEGICWPEFDREAMHWFWFSVILADAFAGILRMCKCQDLRFFQHSIQRPALFYYPSDVVSVFWQKELKGKIKVFKPLRLSFFDRLFCYARTQICKGINLNKRVTLKSKISPSVFAGKIVLVFNSGEFHRFTPIIKQLKRGFPGKVAAAILSDNQKATAKIGVKWSIPVVCGPPFLPADAKLAKKFLTGYRKSLKAAKGRSWEKALKYLDFHFGFYCKQRWPKLTADFRFWHRTFKRWRPKAVIVSSLFDAESQLPGETARKLDIPTFSIPHAGATSKAWDSVSEYILYSFNTQKITHRQAGISTDRLLPCAELFAKNEYSTFPLKLNFNKSKLRVLIITYGISFKDCFIPNIGPRTQLKALEVLNNPPPDIAKKTQFFIKVHPNPNYADLELFEAVGNSLRKKVLPVDSNLHSIISGCDLAILVNSTGSALINILRAGKPVIYFWTDYRSPRTDIFYDIFFSSGMVARNAEELWHLIRSYFTNLKLAKKMRLKAERFHQKYLDDSNYPSISEVIKRVLAKKRNDKKSK